MTTQPANSALATRTISASTAPPVSASTTGADDPLLETLQTRFRHASFRAGQREVCESVLAGEDGLLVMPTGGGKSLCYQLPGLLRSRPTLVISPLIALMDDQAGQMNALGLRAERIHSGLSREHARDAARRYRDGLLDFLFMAPERLRVPNFPEWLARHPPGLIAIDEAHCISMWGHDFRPEYRLLGERLPMVRAANGGVPVLAMTATATVRVQRDIVERLGMPDARRFIRGFARDDLAIEVVECNQAERPRLLGKLLEDDSNRPALVYVLSRKMADELAAQLVDMWGMHAAPYHAGMASERRTEVQTQFLRGDIEVVVATVAFGMGIDKSDVRTVVHVGMPSTIEGYYQEIGRAGRDRQGARAIALFNWGDRRTHEFLLDKSYPPLAQLRIMWGRIGDSGSDRQQIVHSKDDATALDKLVGHGMAEVGFDGFVRRRDGDPSWAQRYEKQRRWRTDQLDDTFAYVGETGCRMAALVRYFGDRRGNSLKCGMCDHCAPADCSLRSFEPPDGDDLAMMEAIVEVLSQRQSDSTGRLFREHVGGGQPKRKAFDRVVAGMERAGYLRGWMDSFETGGRTISYRRIALERGEWLEDRNWAAAVELDKLRATTTRKKRARTRPSLDVSGADEEVVDALRTWRRGKAVDQGVPAYRIFSDATMLQLAVAMPRDREALLRVKGIGPNKADSFGDELLRELNG